MIFTSFKLTPYHDIIFPVSPACFIKLFWLIFNQPSIPGPPGLRRRSAAARPLRLWVPVPPEAWMLSVVFVVCCYVDVSARSWSLVQGSPTDYGPLLSVDLETFRMSRPWPIGGCRARNILILNQIPGFTNPNSFPYIHEYPTPVARESTALFLLSVSCWDNGFKSLLDVDDSCECCVLSGSVCVLSGSSCVSLNFHSKSQCEGTIL